MKWTDEMVSMLADLYPKLGVVATANAMGLTTSQVRAKTSRLQIKAPLSEARIKSGKEHSKRLTGRKNTKISIALKKLHAAGAVNVYKLSEEDRKIRSARTKKYQAEHGHPRGMAGKKHSPETKNIIGKTSKERWDLMTQDQRDNQVMKMIKTREANGTLIPKRIKQSWKADWREIGGKRKYFRSRWEANFARILEKRKQSGEIIEWLHEPKTFWFEGIKRGCVSYLPDFMVTLPDGSEEFYEIKGWMDDRSITKLKRMKKYHPKVVLHLVDSKAYKKIEKEMAGSIEGWES